MRWWKRLGARAQECITIFVYNALVRHWVAPLKETIAPMLEGYRIGMETGDLDFAAFNLFLSNVHSVFSGMDLTELSDRMAKHSQIIAGINQRHALTLQSITWQTILNLMGRPKIRSN